MISCKKKKDAFKAIIIYQPEDKKSYVAYEILLFTQNLLVHIQFETQIGDVLVKDFFVGDLASIPFGWKVERQSYKPTDITSMMCTVYEDSLRFVFHFLYSLAGVRVDVKCFHRCSLLVERTSLEPGWE